MAIKKTDMIEVSKIELYTLIFGMTSGRYHQYLDPNFLLKSLFGIEDSEQVRQTVNEIRQSVYEYQKAERIKRERAS